LPKSKLFEPVRNLLHGCFPATVSLRPAEFCWTTAKKRYADLAADSMCWFAAFSRASHSIPAQMVHEYGQPLLRSAWCDDDNFMQQLMLPV